MFIKLCKENGEDFVVEVLRKIYKTLNQEIQKNERRERDNDVIR